MPARNCGHYSVQESGGQQVAGQLLRGTSAATWQGSCYVARQLLRGRAAADQVLAALPTT